VFVTIFAGQVTTGDSLSLTVTLKLQLAVLPLASVAVQVTVVGPLAKAEPLAGEHRKVVPGQLSLTTGTNATTWLHWPGAVLVLMLAGQVMLGGAVSFTVTVKLQLATLPAASVAVQVTVFVPLKKTLPLVGVQLTVTPEQLSVAVAGAKPTTWLH
jgi:hypothetical protein